MELIDDGIERRLRVSWLFCDVLSVAGDRCRGAVDIGHAILAAENTKLLFHKPAALYPVERA